MASRAEARGVMWTSCDVASPASSPVPRPHLSRTRARERCGLGTRFSSAS